VSDLRSSRGNFDPMNELIILGIRDKGGKDISTNNKEIGGKGVSLSKPPFRTKIIGRLPINKDRKSDSFNTLHNGVGEVRREIHSSEGFIKKVPF
jgi:hypothetical protein